MITTTPAAEQAEGNRRPNIVLILVDDMGFSDIGCYGSEIQTPHLDRLAAGGVRLTQMYNGARCCPTRASLLTGLYPHQAGVGHMVNNLGVPAYQGYLNEQCVTIAEALEPAGYRTYMTGKWHVGGYHSTESADWKIGEAGYPTPLQRGFDRHYGTLAGAGSFFNPHTLMRDGEFVAPEGDDYYYTDAIGDASVEMIREAAADPFFLYVAFTAPHWPLHALPEDIAKYRGRYRQGWDALRQERHARLKQMGIVTPEWEITPRDENAPAWEDLSEEEQDWEDARMAVYAAQIDRMDQNVGKIVRALEEQGVAQDTLIMFLSDNGGCAEFLREDGRHSSAPPLTRDGRPVKIGNIKGLMPGPADTYMSYDLPWANASNTPFRLYKHWVHEGGIATPFIAYWPGTVPENRLAHAPCNLIDIMATCLDAAGATYPRQHGGREIQPPEGESLLPLLHDQAWSRERPICWEHEGNRAVRQGKWKLVSKFPGPWELYDMERDRTELHDLTAEHPEKATELSRIWDVWAQRVGVVPWEEIRPPRRAIPPATTRA
jgi:arylsulfatase A-like enzyme